MRKKYTSAFKAKIVIEALRETKTVSQIAGENGLHPNLVTNWKQAAIQTLPSVFDRQAATLEKEAAQDQKISELYQEIGRLTTQVNWLKKNLASNLTHSQRVDLVERDSPMDMPITDQADLLSVSRASLYYQARGPSELELRVKRRLDELYTARPFLGSRKLVEMLALEGIEIGRHTLRRYRAAMGLETIYPKPRLSLPSDLNERVFPYLLRGLEISRPNQVWSVDITYIRLTGGWMYLVAILDWYSRYVVAWELDDTLELGFVLACADSALNRATPEIVNSDQGSHFTTERFTGRFLAAGSRVSMDGRGRCMDNIFTERLWRTIKYEEVYLTEYSSPREARAGLARYLSYYNQERLHQALGYCTPAQVYRISSQA